MSGTPNYASIPTVGSGRLTAGDTSRTAPAASTTIFTPGASGAQVERITAMPLASTTKTTLRIWRHDGANYHLYCELQIPDFTATATDAIVPQTLEAVNYPSLFPIMVPTGWTIRATINDAQTGIEMTVDGGSF